jgi:hypothetical protein
MFEDVGADVLVGEIEASHRLESVVMARRCAAIARLLAVRTGEAEDADPAAGFALITGFARTTAEVSAAMNMSPMGAQHLVGQAEALHTRLPRIGALLATGGTDWRTVQVIIARTELVRDAAIGVLDASLAGRIGGWQCWSRRRIINAVDAAVRVIDPEAAKERRVRADDERHLSVTALPNGTARVRGILPATAGAVFDKTLSDLASAVCSRDSRTMTQRRADALDALCQRRALACDCGQPDCPARAADQAGPAPGGVRTVINVIATDATVRGDSAQPGYLEGYGVIDAEQVRQLADTATRCPIACPTVTATEALRYQPSAAVARWIRCRDLMCRFPGCERKAWICDLDHTTPFNHADPAAGGWTVPGDLACYCREHHRLKTFHGGPGGWHDDQLADGTIVWTSPTGRTYRSTPPGVDLFPQLRPACRAPTATKRNHAADKAKRIARARATLRQQRPVNAETRRVNHARKKEIADRKWRNQSRRFLILFKGKQHSTSPWCTWLNDPFEPETLPPNWQPPPKPPPPPDDPPF